MLQRSQWAPAAACSLERVRGWGGGGILGFKGCLQTCVILFASAHVNVSVWLKQTRPADKQENEPEQQDGVRESLHPGPPLGQSAASKPVKEGPGPANESTARQLTGLNPSAGMLTDSCKHLQTSRPETSDRAKRSLGVKR